MKKLNLILALLLAFVTADTFALRCGHKVVSVGDHKYDVLKKCGEPEYIDQRTELVANRLRHPYATLEIEQYEQIVIEEWIYNFGRTKFKQLLLFENGILKAIRSLDYGG